MWGEGGGRGGYTRLDLRGAEAVHMPLLDLCCISATSAAPGVFRLARSGLRRPLQSDGAFCAPR